MGRIKRQGSSSQKGQVGRLIGAIIIGIIAGYLGRLVMPGRQNIGFIMTTILGVIGALVGFFIFTEVLGIGDSEAFDLGGLPGAVIGVILVLFLYDRFAGDRRPATA